MNNNVPRADRGGCQDGSANSNGISQAIEYDSQGNVVGRRTLKYDALGRLVEQASSSADGHACLTLGFAYAVQHDGASERAGSADVVKRRGVGECGLPIPSGAADGADPCYVVQQPAAARAMPHASAEVQPDSPDDPVGTIGHETEACSGDPYRYAGYPWDANLALYRTQTRWSDPVPGHWLSEDPAALAGRSPCG